MASSLSSVSSSHHDATTSAPEPAPPPGPPCQAIFHYHTCGCRTKRPVFLCRAPRCSHGPDDGRPISVLVAQAPFACQSSRRAWKRHQSGRVGRGPACAAADPAAARFLREEDTAYALPAADLVRLAACAGLALDELVPRRVDAPRDWRLVVAERYARLPRPPARALAPDRTGPTAELHADAAPARDAPGPLLLPGLGRPSPAAAAAATSGPSELAADEAWPPYRAAAPSGGNQPFAAYQGARLGNSESVLAWLATAHEPVVAADESPLRALLRDSEPLPPSRAAPSSSSSLDPDSPHDRIRRTPRGPGARVDEGTDWSIGAQDPGSDGPSSQSQTSLFGRGIFTYFTGGML